MSEDASLFSTYDLNLTAVLTIKGQHLERVEKNPKGKSLFIFQKTSSLDGVIKQYWQGQIKVEPQELFNTLKQLKNRIYSGY